MDLHYQLTKKEKNLITFVHGLGEDCSVFNKQTAYLQSFGYSTLTLDLRGHGRSKLTEKISISSHAQDLETILEKESISETNLVGFSLGAAVVLEYVYQYPEKVSKLCLINPALYDKSFLTYLVKAAHILLWPLKHLAKIDKHPRKNIVDLSRHCSFLNNLRNTSLAGFHADIKAIKEYGVPSYLSKIKTPTLILVSNKDEVLKPILSQYLHQQLPNSNLITLPGNHNIILKNPEGLNKKLKEFFGGG